MQELRRVTRNAAAGRRNAKKTLKLTYARLSQRVKLISGKCKLKKSENQLLRFWNFDDFSKSNNSPNSTHILSLFFYYSVEILSVE